MKLADNQDRHTIFKDLKLRPERTFHFRYTCPLKKKALSDLVKNIVCLVKNSDGQDMHKISDEFKFGPDWAIFSMCSLKLIVTEY